MEAAKEATSIIRYPVSTEKSIRIMEAENKLIFVVDRRATKPQVKKAVEELFKAKVINVNTYIGPDGNKRAFVQLSPATPAIDIATQLGLM